MRVMMALGGALWSLSSAATGALVPPPVPPPIIELPGVVPGTAASGPSLRTWIAGEVRCGGAVVAPVAMQRPDGELAWPYGGAPKPVTFRFAIDADGRPLSIARDAASTGGPGADLAPALAASRFAAGVARGGCTLTYSPQDATIAQAPLADLIAYSIEPRGMPLPKQGWDRIRAGSTCAGEPRPAPLLRAFPDFRTIARRTGAVDWSLVRYDLDAKGMPVRVAAAWGSGNEALDRAAVKAVVASRFTEGPRTGCLVPFWSHPAPLAAPPPPDVASFAAPGATCPAEQRFATPPRLTFPAAYMRRRIEGWAVVRYDAAPWGEIGNVTVLAAQPSADFGTQAQVVLRSAKVAPSESGFTGCVERVRFVMPPESGPRAERQPEPAADG